MGQVQSQTSVVVLDNTDAWGYHSAKDFNVMGKNQYFRKYLHLHNSLNGASILLSPFAGIIRIITALFLKSKFKGIEQEDAYLDLAATNRFFKMQITRGILEIFGLGIILGTVVDGYMTYKHHKDASLLQRV